MSTVLSTFGVVLVCREDTVSVHVHGHVHVHMRIHAIDRVSDRTVEATHCHE